MRWVGVGVRGTWMGEEEDGEVERSRGVEEECCCQDTG